MLSAQIFRVAGICPLVKKERFRRARDKYRPDKVRLLWIAESPPEASLSYFYFESASGHDHLFRETMRAVGIWPDHVSLRKGTDKRPLLEEFRKKGFFLVDSSPSPVNKLPSNMRGEMLRRGMPGLKRLVSRLDPKHVIIVKSNVYPLAMTILQSSGLKGRVLNRGPLPFPTHGRQRFYRSQVRRLLSRSGLAC